MGRRTKRAALEVLVSFEPARIAAGMPGRGLRTRSPDPPTSARPETPQGRKSQGSGRRRTGGRAKGVSMGEVTAAIYARVSTEQQTRGNTVASQLASLRERAEADEVRLEPGSCVRR